METLGLYRKSSLRRYSDTISLKNLAMSELRSNHGCRVRLRRLWFFSCFATGRDALFVFYFSAKPYAARLFHQSQALV